MHYTREAIVKHVQAHTEVFGVPLNRITVAGQAAIVMHGLKESTDAIVCDVHRNDFVRLMADYPNLPNNDTLCGPGIWASKDLWYIDCGSVNQDVCEIDGLIVMSLEELKRQYVFLSYHPTRTEYESAASRKILAVIDEHLQASKGKSDTTKTITESLAAFSEGIWELPRLTAYVKSTPVGTYVPFHGAYGRVWFAMHVINNGQNFVQIYETDLHSVDAVNLNAVCFKHLDNQLRYQTAVS